MPQELPNPEWLRIGATVRQLRVLRGLTPDELANKVDISRPYLANIEAGRKKLQPVHAARIAQVLDVRPLSILRPDEWPDGMPEAS